MLVIKPVSSNEGFLKPGYAILRHEVDGCNEVPKHTWVITKFTLKDRRSHENAGTASCPNLQSNTTTYGSTLLCIRRRRRA